jgi:zinc transporter, ZIP family
MPLNDATGLVFLRVGIAVLAAAIGAAFGVAGRRSSHYVLCSLVSFAAGALLSVTVVDIIPESAHLIGWPRCLAFGAAGLMIFYVIGRFVYYICPACAASASEERQGYLRLGILLMTTLALHSTVDGAAIAAGASSGVPLTGMLILVAVSYHKIPEGLALASVARLAGYGKGASFALALLIEFTTGVGALLGLLLLRSPSETWIGNVLALIAGSFLYVVAFALIKEMMKHERRSIVGFVVLGFVSIALLRIIFGALGYGEAH